VRSGGGDTVTKAGNWFQNRRNKKHVKALLRVIPKGAWELVESAPQSMAGATDVGKEVDREPVQSGVRKGTTP